MIKNVVISYYFKGKNSNDYDYMKAYLTEFYRSVTFQFVIAESFMIIET